MNTLFKFVAAIAVVVVIAVGSVFFLTGDMVDATDDFFDSVKNNDINSAYNGFANNFKTVTSEQELQAFINENALDKTVDTSWTSRSIDPSKGEISGFVTTEDGVIPLTIGYIKEQDEWKIHSLRKPAAGLQSGNAAQAPGPNKLLDLTHTSINHFAQSVKQRSMRNFHDQISNLWRKQFSVGDLDNAFVAFYNANIDLTVLEPLTPVINNDPTVDSNGVLLVTGLYHTQPSQLHFEQKFIYEGLNWKLVGFSANIK